MITDIDTIFLENGSVNSQVVIKAEAVYLRIQCK